MKWKLNPFRKRTINRLYIHMSTEYISNKIRFLIVIRVGGGGEVNILLNVKVLFQAYKMYEHRNCSYTCMLLCHKFYIIISIVEWFWSKDLLRNWFTYVPGNIIRHNTIP